MAAGATAAGAMAVGTTGATAGIIGDLLGAMPSARPTLYGSRHAVSAGHYLAAAAGFSILEAGGNAIGAGCAAGIALALPHPDQVNVAGLAAIMILPRP